MRIALIAMAIGASAACTVEAPTRSNENASAAAAPLRMRVGANLQNQVEVVGAVIEPGKVTPGIPAKVNVFFKVLEPMKTDWMVFVHLEDAEGKAERSNADHPPVGGTYPTSAWKKGETVRDEFSLYLPPGYAPRALNVFLGLWDPRSDQRMKLENPDQVRNDGRDRILVAQVPVAHL